MAGPRLTLDVMLVGINSLPFAADLRATVGVLQLNEQVNGYMLYSETYLTLR